MSEFIFARIGHKLVETVRDADYHEEAVNEALRELQKKNLVTDVVTRVVKVSNTYLYLTSITYEVGS